jgi:hypothetical protein
MLVVHVHVRVKPGQAEDLAEPRASARFSAVFPAGGEGWSSGRP